ncbi:MAG: alanine--tRNA ligase [Planctomycetota bacterium]|jgi:alanyl-tRNA synthetase
MKPDELREAYLSFFESKGHMRRPSDSLVPANDPTLLFTGAGMNQFKEAMLGLVDLGYKRATTSQKCFRTGDLDNVGRTYYHQTFFEMLGNFSFGDYFKREAILWQWEFLTEVIKLPTDKLSVSVYAEDDEAYAIWRDDVKVPENRIWRMGAKDNFWPADAPKKGPNGPCGPCSEIFYDFGSPGEEGDPEAERYCEIGNIVFTQFNRVGENELEPLAQKNIDTGMGFARILAVSNGVRSNFETELFLPMIRKTAEIAGEDYSYDHPLGQQFRRIAEHARAAVFLVADGVKPSNEGRGYVARRILRRAVRDGIALGIERPFLHELVPVVVEVMGRAYPEVVTAQQAAATFIQAEEEKFRETYEAGMTLLEQAVADMVGGTLDGQTAFTLYDSHGFPLELSEEILAERGLKVDRQGFDRCMEAQRKRSREGSTIAGEVFQATIVTDIKKRVGATEFLGYDHIRADGTVMHQARESGRTALILDRTPFYAEAGGQVGDTGVIEGDGWLFNVADTKKLEGYTLHWGHFQEGDKATGKADMVVDGLRRRAITRNHSATHLLHAALRNLLGTHVTQAGSLVAPDRLRFDFTHPRAVSSDELFAIEQWVNDEILRDAPVQTSRMPIDDARAAGAMALFGEKYDDVVRVVTIGEQSMELCGGIHVGHSTEIGACLLAGESSVASGVRRIEMVTGMGALKAAIRQRTALRTLSDALKTAPEQLGERIAALQSEIKELKKATADQAKKSSMASIEGLLEGAPRVGDVTIVVGRVSGDPRSAADALRAKLGESAVLLASPSGAGAKVFAAASDGAIRAGVKAGDVVKSFTSSLGGKGGGRPQSAQGHVPSVEGLDQALAAAEKDLVAALSAV